MKMLFSRTAAALALVSALAGCAHSLVYSESRDKQGQEAKRAAGELKLGEVVKQLERGYSEVAKLELESGRSLAETLREKELGRVVRASAMREPQAGSAPSQPARSADVGQHIPGA